MLAIQTKIGRKIKSLRALQGMTQKDLEEVSKVSQREISRYESGDWRAINPGHLLAIANALKVSVDDIFCRQELANRNSVRKKKG